MIKEDFYPTVYTATAGKYTGSARTLANSGEYSPEEFANPYTMGYIPDAEIPLPLVVSNCNVVGEGEDAVIQFRRANNGNMLWGLSMAYSNNLGSGWHGAAFYYSSIENAWNSTNFSSGYASYFINEAEVINYQLKSYYKIDYMSIKHNGDGTWSDSTVNSGYNIYKNAEEIRKFIAGEENWTLKIAGQNTLEVSYSMVNSYGMLEYRGEDYTIYFMFRHMIPQNTYSSCAVSVSNGRGTSMIPFYKFTATKTGSNDDDDATTCFYATSAPGEVSLPFKVDRGVVTPNIHHTFNGMYAGIDDADLPLSEVPGNTDKVYNQFFIYNKNVYPAIPLTEMYKMLCIPNKFYKNSTGTSGSIPSSNTYDERYTVAQFDKSNRPMWSRLNGSFASILPKLQIWQYPATDIAENDFDPSHVIPPAPPRPDPVPPDDDENGGDDYEPNDPAGLGVGTGFTTMYAIRSTHLRELGAKLWTGFTDINNYINNFVFAVDPNTGSVNFADIMQFFISLRAYPCPISAMTTTSAGGQDMYIGSGAAPIHLNTNFSIVDEYIGTINAGELTVPFWFGDYRDYSLECIVYLPYCGTAELNAADIMGGKLSAFYTVDFCTGACMAYVLCDTWDGTRIRVASLSGQLGADLPMTATNAGQVSARMYGDRINVAENILGGVKSAVTGIGAVASGNFAGAVRQGFDAFISPSLNEERLKSQMGTRSAIAAPMLSAGRGLASFTDAKTVFLQIRSPIYAVPANYNAAVGQPATDAVTIGDCSGFCQFINVDVTGITTDADDQRAIRQALETGVII